MRYQEWWWKMFTYELRRGFDEVLVMGKHPTVAEQDASAFAPAMESVVFELSQIREYTQLQLKEDDVLLLNDISFPGLFAHVLFHKRPKKCIAICHGTSKNAFDYFSNDRKSKEPVERNVAKLFDTIVVATEYHKKKLGWPNIFVTPFPNPPYSVGVPPELEKRSTLLIAASRFTRQKRSMKVERVVTQKTGVSVETTYPVSTWAAYYKKLLDSRILLITSKEETYGYQVIDAIKCGCLVFAPNKFSYPELLPYQFLYDTTEDLVQKVQHALINPNPWYLRMSGEAVVKARGFYGHLLNILT
jgi:hypothetical protein